MVYRDFTFGESPVPSAVLNTNYKNVLGFCLATRLNGIFDGDGSSSQENLIYDNDNSDIDIVNTTAFLFGTTYYGSSTGTEEEVTYDDFGDSSIDTTNRWTNSRWAEGSGYASASTAASSCSGSDIDVLTQKTGTTNLLGKTIVIDFSVPTNAQANGGRAYSRISLNGITVWSSTASTTYAQQKMKIEPDTTNPDTSVMYSFDTGGGYGATVTVDISGGNGNGLLMFTTYCDSSGSGCSEDSASNTFRLYELWFDNYEASDLITNNQTIDSSNTYFTIPDDADSGTDQRVTSIKYSIDNGSSYSADITRREAYYNVSASVQIKLKYAFAFDNSLVYNQLTTKITGWGAYSL